MLVTEHGTRLTGTVGGGCMEADVVQAARRLYADNLAQIMTFHLNENEYVQGLICGGSLEVLIEPIDGTMVPLFEKLRSRCEAGEDSIVATRLQNDGTIAFKKLVESPGDIEGIGDVNDLSEEFRKSFHRHETRRVKVAQGELILEPIVGTPSLIIFGGGHVSRFVSQAAAMSGFRVTVVDDRPEYANANRFPEAAQTVVAEFDKPLSIKPSTYVVIVTRGHRYDEEILEQVIRTPTRYIGMIGSKRKVLTAFERLVERGVSPEQLHRVHAPMGLEIGAVTAEEIGISVVAELIAVRRGFEGVVLHKSDAMQQLRRRLGALHQSEHSQGRP